MWHVSNKLWCGVNNRWHWFGKMLKAKTLPADARRWSLNLDYSWTSILSEVWNLCSFYFCHSTDSRTSFNSKCLKTEEQSGTERLNWLAIMEQWHRQVSTSISNEALSLCYAMCKTAHCFLEHNSSHLILYVTILSSQMVCLFVVMFLFVSVEISI